MERYLCKLCKGQSRSKVSGETGEATTEGGYCVWCSGRLAIARTEAKEEGRRFNAGAVSLLFFVFVIWLIFYLLGFVR